MKYVGLDNPWPGLDKMIESYRKSLPRDRTQFPTEDDLLKELDMVKEVLYGAAYGATIRSGESMMSTREFTLKDTLWFGKQKRFTIENVTHDEATHGETVHGEVTDDEAILEEDT